MTGIIFDIQRFSLHDGPGIRTTVFMKGCPLHCKWCHNPEGLEKRITVRLFEELCIGCGECEKSCENKLHTLNEKHIINFRHCTGCGQCVNACPSEALKLTAKSYTVAETVEAVLRDSPFYVPQSEREPAGGVTFSGGEALLQADFVAETARILKNKGVSVTVDTCGCVPYAEIQKVLPFTDVFLYDIKAITDEKHIFGTGVSNRLILENLKRLDKEEREIWIRVPVIPTVNDSAEEITLIAEFCRKLKNVTRATLMPYHILGSEKYPSVGLEYMFDKTLSVSKDNMSLFCDIFAEKGVNVVN